jgi:hypothetical protein
MVIMNVTATTPPLPSSRRRNATAAARAYAALAVG